MLDRRRVFAGGRPLYCAMLLSLACFSDVGNPAGNDDGTASSGASTSSPASASSLPSTSVDPSSAGSTTGDDASSSADSTDAATTTDGLVGCAHPDAPMGCGDGLVALGEVCFADEAETLDLGTVPRRIAAADLDADAHVDVVVEQQPLGPIASHRGQGDGTFGPAISVVNSGGGRFALGNLDDDPILDVVILTGGALEVTGRVGDGTGAFNAFDAGAVSTIGLGGIDIAIGDLDGNGYGDVVVPTYDGVSVLAATDAGFEPLTELTAGPDSVGAQYVALADLQDGSLDLVVTYYATVNVGTYINDGSGVLVPLAPTSVGSGSDGAVDIALADFDSDRDVDVVAPVLANSEVHVLLNEDGELQTDSSPFLVVATAVAAGDFDGDCVDDLVMVVTVGELPHVGFYASNGDGTFDEPVMVEIAAPAQDLVLADINEDGPVDALVTMDGVGVGLILSRP